MIDRPGFSLDDAVMPLTWIGRAAGWALLLHGLLYWNGHARKLVVLHIVVGFVLSAALLGLAAIALIRILAIPVALVAVVCSVAMPIYGLHQQYLLHGVVHIIVRASHSEGMVRWTHFLIGLAAIGLIEMLTRRIRDDGFRDYAAARAPSRAR